jgi:hypothetical protein
VQRRFKVGNREVVKRINVESRPSAGATQAKPDNYRDTTREPSGKPTVDNNVEDAKESKGAAKSAAQTQAADTTRSWWTPEH